MCSVSRQSAMLLALALWLRAVPAPAGVDEGMSRYVPWSGSYWPIRYGMMIHGPLRQYDRATGHHAARWEWEKNPPGPEVPYWFGYCHAWASAAVMDREPLRLRQVSGIGGIPVRLGIADQKGMLTACHTNDVAQHYGLRYTGAAGEDRNDIYPDELWRILRLYVRQQGVPIVMDIEAGTQVWNYPVFAYRIVYRPTGRGHEHFAEMSLWMADDAVPADYLGTKVAKASYYFTFDFQGGMARAGSGRWVGPSVRDHPDFAWYPHVAVADNPEVKYSTVKRLVDRSGTGPSDVQPPENQPGPTSPGSVPGTERPALPPNFLPPRPGAPAMTQDRPLPISPLELLSLVVNKTSAFDLDVTVDKFDGGRYVGSEPLWVSGTSQRAGYLYLFYVDGEGQLMPLFPPPGVDNQIRAQQKFHFPPADGGYAFRTMPVAGTHRIKAVVTLAPLGVPSMIPTPDAVQTSSKRLPEFHLPPSQKDMIKDVLGRYRRGQPIGSEELGEAAPRNFLGEFAQDEVAFYVGPPEGVAP